MANADGSTAPNWTSVAFSSTTGESDPFGYRPTRSGIPCAASQARPTAPSSPPLLLRRHLDAVRRLAALDARVGPGDARVAQDLRQLLLDLGDGRDAVLLLRVLVGRDRAAVDRVRLPVVDPERLVVGDDLRVAGVALQLEAEVIGRPPEPPGRAADERRDALEGARVDEVVLEVDARGHALDGRCDQRVVDSPRQVPWPAAAADRRPRRRRCRRRSRRRSPSRRRAARAGARSGVDGRGSQSSPDRIAHRDYGPKRERGLPGEFVPELDRCLGNRPARVRHSGGLEAKRGGGRFLAPTSRHQLSQDLRTCLSLVYVGVCPLLSALPTRTPLHVFSRGIT